MCSCLVGVLSFSFYCTVEWARTNAHLIANGDLLKTTTGLENSKAMNTSRYAVFATRFSNAYVRPESRSCHADGKNDESSCCKLRRN